MLLRDGSRCRYRAKVGAMCGIHRRESATKRKAIEKLVQAGKIAGAVTALAGFIEKFGPLLVKAAPILNRWLAAGATMLDSHHFVLFCRTGEWQRVDVHKRLLQVTRYMEESGDYSTFSELSEAVFAAIATEATAANKS